MQFLYNKSERCVLCMLQRDLNAIEMMPRVLTLPSPELVEVTLAWLYNMSFDLESRERMVRVGFLPRFVSLMSM